MSVGLIIFLIVSYFGVLMLIAQFTSRNSNTQTFFNANKQSPWYLVAFGMIGTSISGVTFISIPGAVLNDQFAYFQIVLGYLLGYLVIATVLLPLYYRLNLVSIYTYLEQRFGYWSYKTGAFFFLLSRTIGSAFRLFLAATVLQVGLFDNLGVPFWLTTLISIFLIWIYTYQGGIKTIVWTDTLQTAFLITAGVVSVILIKDELGLSFTGLVSTISESNYSKTFYFGEWSQPNSFTKQFLSGAFITIVMTGLDQDMMQKNLTCRNLKDAQKNMFWFSVVLVLVNIVFLSLGALLYIYAQEKGIDLPMKDGKIITDKVYPFLAFNHFSLLAGIAFLLGIIASTYASSDSALAALTTSFSVDILEVSKKEESQRKRIVRRVHVGFSLVLVIVILIFKMISDAYPESNVIGNLFKAAGYTYGPLLGLYAFGLFTKFQVKDGWVPLVCLLSPVLSYILNTNSKEWLWGYQFGFEIGIVNALFTFIGLLILVKRK